VARLSERKAFDIIGHFDLVAKNNERGRFLDTAAKEYPDLGLEAIHALKGEIPFFELNTGAIARGYRTAP
jgi:histidinol-phosphatase (PHP family)